MLPSLIDLIFVAYIFYGISRGKKGGLTKELPKLLGIFIAFTTGLGLLRWTGRVLATTAQMTSQVTGTLGVLASLVTAYMVVRHFRSKIRKFVDDRYPETKQQQRGGAIAGGLRTSFVIAFVVGIISHSDIRILEKALVEKPLISRCLTALTNPLFHIADQSE